MASNFSSTTGFLSQFIQVDGEFQALLLWQLLRYNNIVMLSILRFTHLHDELHQDDIMRCDLDHDKRPIVDRASAVWRRVVGIVSSGLRPVHSEQVEGVTGQIWLSVWLVAPYQA